MQGSGDVGPGGIDVQRAGNGHRPDPARDIRGREPTGRAHDPCLEVQGAEAGWRPGRRRQAAPKGGQVGMLEPDAATERRPPRLFDQDAVDRRLTAGRDGGKRQGEVVGIATDLAVDARWAEQCEVNRRVDAEQGAETRQVAVGRQREPQVHIGQRIDGTRNAHHGGAGAGHGADIAAADRQPAAAQGGVDRQIVPGDAIGHEHADMAVDIGVDRAGERLQGIEGLRRRRRLRPVRLPGAIGVEVEPIKLEAQADAGNALVEERQAAAEPATVEIDVDPSDSEIPGPAGNGQAGVEPAQPILRDVLDIDIQPGQQAA